WQRIGRRRGPGVDAPPDGGSWRLRVTSVLGDDQRHAIGEQAAAVVGPHLTERGASGTTAGDIPDDDARPVRAGRGAAATPHHEPASLRGERETDDRAGARVVPEIGSVACA